MSEEKMSYDSNVVEYITQHDLPNARKALALMQELAEVATGKNKERVERDLVHSMDIVEMLLDLDIPFCEQDRDILLAVALCHTLTENRGYITAPYDRMLGCGMAPETCEVLEMISGRDLLNEEELKAYYLRIQEQPIALMIVLADRGSILQRLHQVSSWQAHRHSYETKTYYFPMCIYGKEKYPELLRCISILMEKMRSLIELSEMMLSRYEAKEMELLQDILAMREENATIKGIIRRLRGETP